MFESFLDWDLKDAGLVTNLGPVPFVPWGTTRESLIEGKKHTQREGFYVLRRSEVGVKESVNSGAMTRISGDLSWNGYLENTWNGQP